MTTKRDKEIGLTLNFLIMPYENGYMALCRETGLIRSGETLDQAHKALESATRTLLEAIRHDKELEPSLRAGLPLKYRFLFDWTVLKLVFNRAMHNLLFVRQNVFDLQLRPV